jgi:phage-related protein (TIGR01555 family)
MNFLRRLFGMDSPAVMRVDERAAPGPLSMKVDPGLLSMLDQKADKLANYGDLPVISRRLERYTPPPGVAPQGYAPQLAMDDATNAALWEYANQTYCGVGFPGYAYLSQLTTVSEYRAPSETIASEMTRKFIELKVAGKAKKDAKDSEDKIQKLNEAMELFGVQESFYRIAEQDGFFGRSQLFIDIDHDGRDENDARKLPLVISRETIKKGSLQKLKVIEPIWTTPASYDASDPTSTHFFRPKAWYVQGREIHHSRLLTFVSREVPDLLKPAFNFGGMSMSQLMEPYIRQWLRTRNSVSDLIHNFSIILLKTNMSAALGYGGGSPTGPQGVFDRIRLFLKTRDNQGIMTLDKDTEEMDQIAVPLSGLDALQAQAQEHMASPSHIPLVKLLGITPTGLNASSEGEIRVFYDFVHAMQSHLFRKHLRTVLQVLQLHLFGEIDDAITFEFVPLMELDGEALARNRKSDAEAGATYIASGVIDAAEERERLRADPNSGYNNLDGPPPELSPDEAAAEADRMHQSSEADKAREHTSQEAAKNREVPSGTKKPS